MHVRRAHERRLRRDRGLNTVNAGTRGALSGGLALSLALGAVFAWTAPGHATKAAAPDEPVHSAPAAEKPTGHAARSSRRPALRPPAQKVTPTHRPPKTTSGGS
jgi:hypothetical protein